MAYGFEIFNANGDRVVEFKKTLYAAETGSTSLSTDIYDAAHAKAVAAGYTTSYPNEKRLPGSYSVEGYAFGGVYVRKEQMAAGDSVAEVKNSTTIIRPSMDLGLGDTVFYKINSKGLTSQGQIFCDLPGGYPSDKGVGLCTVESDASLDYIIASTTAANGSGETYGLQIRDDAGVVTFDSRKPLFSIFHSFIITSAHCDDVINTGTPKVYTLPKSVAGAYVSAPSLLGYKLFPGAGAGTPGMSTIMLKQTANNKLTLSRVVYRSGAGAFKFWTQDTPVFVGRPL